MYGNLSKTIVSVPNGFHLSSYLTSSNLTEKINKQPTIYDAFSQLKYINTRVNNRYFRLSEHFKENSPYHDLNFNNNKRYISPIAVLKPISLNRLLFSQRDNFNKKFRKSISQPQLLSKSNTINLSQTTNRELSKDNLNETHSSQIINIISNSNKDTDQFKQQNLSEKERNNLSKINEVLPIEEITKEYNSNENDSQKREEEEKKIKENYLKKLEENKPHNISELTKYLNINFCDKTKSKPFFPKIGRVPFSMSQDDLFKKTLSMKLNSLTMVRPEIKEGIFRRKKNMIMKRDYDMIRRIYNVRKKLPFHLKNILSHEALIQQ